ncbi:methylmalonyl-CoA mutase [Streptomyces badius]
MHTWALLAGGGSLTLVPALPRTGRRGPRRHHDRGGRPRGVEALHEAGAASVFPPGTVIPDAAHDLVTRLGAALGHEL